MCALCQCNRQTRPSDRLRPVRALHFHWARLMELDSERHWLSGVFKFEIVEVVAWWDGVCSAQGMCCGTVTSGCMVGVTVCLLSSSARTAGASRMMS